MMMTLMLKKESREDPDAVWSTLIGVFVGFVFFSVLVCVISQLFI